MTQTYLRTRFEDLYELLGDDHLLHDAFDVADLCHRGQFRSTSTGKVPYILHPLWVFFRLVSWGVTDKVTLASALLHDTVEDAPETVWKVTASPLRIDSTPETPRERALLGLTHRFGPEVASVVDGLSNRPGVGYIEHVREATRDGRVLVVKTGDFTHNALGLDPAHPRYEKLRAKYAPLYPVLISHLATNEDAHSILPAWQEVLASLVSSAPRT